MHALEVGRFASRRLVALLGRCETLWLAGSGMPVYRSLRRLLEQAEAAADAGGCKISVIDLPGKSDVEVEASVWRARRVRIFRCAFPRYQPGSLERGFVEGAE